MAPRVETVEGVSINVYFADHNPPHFHARQAGDEALIGIRDLTVIQGGVSSLKSVLAWAAANRATLIAEWNRCNPDKPY